MEGSRRKCAHERVQPRNHCGENAQHSGVDDRPAAQKRRRVVRDLPDILKLWNFAHIARPEAPSTSVSQATRHSAEGTLKIEYQCPI